jgi:hypothetical protein
MARLDAKGVKTREGQPSIQPPGTSLESMFVGEPGKPTSLKGVLFGPPKTGKTTLSTSAGKTLIINFDPDGPSTKTLKGRKDIDIVQPETLAETENVLKAIIGGEADSYEFITLDSVTWMFQKFGGRQILKTFQANKDVRRAYGHAGAAAGQIIHDLAMLPNNIIFIAHLQKEYDEDDGTVDVDQDLGEFEVSLAVTPMVWKILGGAVGFIGRTYKDQISTTSGNSDTRYLVSFNDGSRSPAGSRYEMEGLYEQSPTLLAELVTDLL